MKPDFGQATSVGDFCQMTYHLAGLLVRCRFLLVTSFPRRGLAR